MTAGQDPARPPPSGAPLVALIEVMDVLRRRCPWDRAQTHASLAPYLLEETYETLAALDEGDAAAIADELGDVLLQVYFHARVASERADGFTIDDVAEGLARKLRRRHPHVFPDAGGRLAAADTAGDVQVSNAAPSFLGAPWCAKIRRWRVAGGLGLGAHLSGSSWSTPDRL